MAFVKFGFIVPILNSSHYQKNIRSQKRFILGKKLNLVETESKDSVNNFFIAFLKMNDDWRWDLYTF